MSDLLILSELAHHSYMLQSCHTEEMSYCRLDNLSAWVTWEHQKSECQAMYYESLLQVVCHEYYKRGLPLWKSRLSLHYILRQARLWLSLRKRQKARPSGIAMQDTTKYLHKKNSLARAFLRMYILCSLHWRRYWSWAVQHQSQLFVHVRMWYRLHEPLHPWRRKSANRSGMQCTKAGACCDLVSLLKNNDLLWRQMHQPYPDFLSSARITSSCVLVTLDHA